MLPSDNGLDAKDAISLMGRAGSISIHHGRIVHGSSLNTSDRARRILFYEMMAADAFPLMGAMTRWEGIKDYDDRMLCGSPTLNPRLKDIPVRIPQPQPDVPISINEIQKGMQKKYLMSLVARQVTGQKDERGFDWQEPQCKKLSL